MYCSRDRRCGAVRCDVAWCLAVVAAELWLGRCSDGGEGRSDPRPCPGRREECPAGGTPESAGRISGVHGFREKRVCWYYSRGHLDKRVHVLCFPPAVKSGARCVVEDNTILYMV